MVVQNYQADAFSVPVMTQGGHNQSFQFAGEQRNDTGLIHLRVGFYDPATGRFMRRDPCSESQP